MNKLWSIPLISLFFYLVTTITQYGFNSYFNIPPSFIEVSLRYNIVYFYRLFNTGIYLAGIMKWWIWVVIVFSILIVVFLYNFSSLLSKFLRYIFVFILLIIVIISYNFGIELAKNTSEFYIVPSSCISGNENNLYIAPIFYDKHIIFISIDKSTNRIKEGLVIKDISDLNCPIEYHKIEKIIK